MEDKILRATAGNAQVRIFVADTKNLVEEAFEKHQTMPVATAALGRMLTAGAIMGVLQKGEKDLLTIKIQGDGPMESVTVTADARARVKGYVANPLVDIPLKPNGKLDVSGAIGNGDLTVIKDMGLKEPYVGRTRLQTGEIAEDLTFYFTVSEQVPSSMGLGVLVDRDYHVKCAGGFLVQLMPFAEEEVIAKLEKNLSKITGVTSMLEEGKTPEDILNIIAEGLEPEVVDTITPSYYCNCSKERVQKALISLGKEELQSMIDEQKEIEIHCDFCNKYYYFSVKELEELCQNSR